MKKIYIAAAFCFGIVAAQAQYTVTASQNHVIGDVVETYDADTTGVSTGANGTGVTWNYTGVVITPTAVSSSTYVAKTSAPNYTAFPSATMAQDDGSGTYTMVDYGTSAFTVYGTTSSSLSIVFSNPETLYTIPFTYGSSSNDTYAGTFTISGFPVNQTGTITTTGVGMGTLNMPGGKSYSNVLKVKIATHSVSSITSLGYSSTQDAVTCAYMSSMSKNPILTINTSTTVSTTTATSTSYDKSVSVDKTAQLTGIKEYQKESNFSLYPNPSNGAEVSLFFVLTANETYEVSVYNTMGQEVRKNSLGTLSPGIYNEKLDLSGLDRGIYFVRLKGRQADGLQKLIIQ